MQIKVVICFAFTKKYDRFRCCCCCCCWSELNGFNPHTHILRNIHRKVEFFLSLFRTFIARMESSVHRSHHRSPIFGRCLIWVRCNYLVSFISLLYSIKCIWRIYHAWSTNIYPFFKDELTSFFCDMIMIFWPLIAFDHIRSSWYIRMRIVILCTEKNAISKNKRNKKRI